MWFLAGTFGGGTVTRRCTIPHGRSLLFPIVNAFSGAAPSDPPEQRTEAYHRGQVAAIAGATNLSVRIDGRRLPRPRRYFALSTVFRVTLPADNVLGVNAACQQQRPVTAGCTIFPTVDAGFYVAVRPLAVGRHRIHFAGTIPGSTPSEATTVDVTYLLRVRRRA